jgi:hypothetical protein
MNSKDTVLAVMKDVQGLREHDRKTGQDARWQGLDKVPDAALHSLKMHGGRLTHEDLHSEFSTDTTHDGVLVDSGMVIIQFNVYGSEGDPVTGVVSAEATNNGGNASAKVYKRALRTFLVELLQLPNDRGEPSDEFSEVTERDRYLLKRRRIPRPKARKRGRIADIPWSPRTEALGAQIASLTLDEYAVEWARYYLDRYSQGIAQIPGDGRPFLIKMLLGVGFSDSQAEHGASRALPSEVVVA